jgi:hypothetical protein
MMVRSSTPSAPDGSLPRSDSSSASAVTVLPWILAMARAKASLEDVRRFRQHTAALLGVCKEANFTMTGRFVHMARCITTQWNVAELNASIDANTALLDLMYEGLEDDRKDRRDFWMNLFLATLALLTVVSVTNDFVTFVIQNAAKSRQYWFALATNPQSLTPVLILVSPAVIIVVLVGIVIWRGAVIWKWVRRVLPLT